MEAFSITPTLSPTVASPPGAGASATGPSDAGAAGTSFGGIFNALRPEAGRQDLAAGLFGSGLPGPQLVSQPLGEAMAVITADSPVPAQDSLLAFARSQGLDEAAIAALWQQPAASTTPASVSAGPSLSLPNLPAAVGLHPGGTGATTSATAPSPMTLHMMGLVVQGLPTPTDKPAATPTANSPEPDPAVLQSLRLTPQSLGLRITQRPQTPAQALAENSALGAKTPSSPPQEPPTLTLDLESELAEITRPSPPDTRLDTATSTASAPMPEPGRPQGQTSQASAAGIPAPTVISGYQLKAEHYQQLADRMGQALAQRLQEQIESGQWSMKLRLNPAELGQIDVQLDMHQGGLDARFQTDNPLTKDLILQGSGRLKDSLNQHGMTVASVWVNSDDRRQSGGNSTPQQQQRRAPSGQTTSRTESVVEASAPRQSRADGWDMLA